MGWRPDERGIRIPESKYGIGLPIYYLPFVAAGYELALAAGRPASQITGFLLWLANIPFAMLTLILFASLLRLFKVSGHAAIFRYAHSVSEQRDARGANAERKKRSHSNVFRSTGSGQAI